MMRVEPICPKCNGVNSLEYEWEDLALGREHKTHCERCGCFFRFEIAYNMPNADYEEEITGDES